MAELVDDDVLDTCTIIATPDTVAAEVGARYGGLVDRITVSAGGARTGGPRAATSCVRCDGRARLRRAGLRAGRRGARRTAQRGHGRRPRAHRRPRRGGGGAFAAYVDGECVVDIWAGRGGARRRVGRRDRGRGHVGHEGADRAVRPHLLDDRGELDVDAPVVTYWPEFGAAGKANDTRPPPAEPPVRCDRRARRGRACCRGTAPDGTTALASPPRSPADRRAGSRGPAHGYHGVTFGWLVGELVRRVSGVSLGTFFRTEVAEPLERRVPHRHTGGPSPPTSRARDGVDPTQDLARAAAAARGLRSIPSPRPGSRCSPARTGACSSTSTASPGSRRS